VTGAQRVGLHLALWQAEYARFLAAQQGRPPRLHEAHAVDEAAAERTLLEPHSPSELVPRKFGQGLRAMHWGAGGGIASEAVIRKKAYSDELQRQIRERKVHPAPCLPASLHSAWP
jgi:hypothetical protein